MKKTKKRKNKKWTISQQASLIAVVLVFVVACGAFLFQSLENSRQNAANAGQQGGLNVGDMGNDEVSGGDEGTGDEGTGNEGTGNEGTGNEGTGNEGTGNEGTGNQGTGNEGTGNQGGNSDLAEGEGGRIF